MSRNPKDYPPLTEAQKKLIEENIRLPMHFIRESFKNDEVPRKVKDDFISDVLLNFCVSAMGYEEERGFKFSTFAHGGFNFALAKSQGYRWSKYKKYNFVSMKRLRRITYTKHNLPTNHRSFSGRKSNEMPAFNNGIGFVHSNTHIFSVNDKKVKEGALDEFIESSGLRPREKNMIKEYFWGGFTLKEIGIKYNVTRERIRQIIAKGVSKIKKKLQKEGIQIEDFFEVVR